MTVSAKKIQVSIDGGTTWNTLPGSQGQFSDDAGQLDDTVFGQNFKSNQPGLLSWSVSCDALYKGFAGYVATLKLGGTPTIMTNEACTQIGATKSYQITNTAHRIIDHNSAVTVKDNGVNQTANVISIDYLFGIVTFAAGYTVTGPVTVTGNYIPTTSIGRSNSFTLTQQAAADDTTDFDNAQSNGGYMLNDQGLQTISLELKGFWGSSDTWRTTLEGRTECIIEINPDGSQLSVARGYFKISSVANSGNVGDVEDRDLKFDLYVPVNAPLMTSPFEWAQNPGTTLSTAVINTLNAFLNYSGNPANALIVRYLPDGSNGWQGYALVTECTLSGGVEAMNSFSVKYMGSGGLTAVTSGGGTPPPAPPF